MVKSSTLEAHFKLIKIYNLFYFYPQLKNKLGKHRKVEPRVAHKHVLEHKFTSPIFHIAKARPTPNPQLHGRAQVAARNTHLTQCIPSPLQGQRLRRLEHTHGQACTAKIGDRLLCLLVEH